MKAYTFSQYLDVNCPLRNPSPSILFGLMRETQGRVCTTGCGYFDGGKCASYKNLITSFNGEGEDLPNGDQHIFDRMNHGRNETSTQRVIRQRQEASGKQNRTNTVPGYVKPLREAPTFKHIEYTETVAEQATRMGVSKSEVRRIRNQEANSVDMLKLSINQPRTLGEILLEGIPRQQLGDSKVSLGEEGF
jgi:hypothetical protein